MPEIEDLHLISAPVAQERRIPDRKAKIRPPVEFIASLVIRILLLPSTRQQIGPGRRPASGQGGVPLLNRLTCTRGCWS